MGVSLFLFLGFWDLGCIRLDWVLQDCLPRLTVYCLDIGYAFFGWESNLSRLRMMGLFDGGNLFVLASFFSFCTVLYCWGLLCDI